MLKKSITQITAIVFVMTVFLSFDASAKIGVQKAAAAKTFASQTNCSKTTDDDLVKTITEKLKAEFADQMNHVNVSVKNRVVKLEGWLDGKAAVDKAFAIAKKTKCAKSVVNKLKTRGGGSCGAGQKPCGDTCIEKNSACTIVLDN
jgi:osmotically-inducible protein OsmY